MGEELGDGVTLAQVTLGGLKKWELVSWVESLVCWGLSLLVGVNYDLEGLVGDFGHDFIELNQDVAWHLGVDFLCKKEGKKLARNSVFQDNLLTYHC